MGNAYWFDEGTITVEQDDGTATAVAGFQGLTVEAAYENLQQLYTADSVFIESQKQSNHLVNVTIDFSKWDSDAAEVWLGGGSAASESTDTSDPAKFTVRAVSTAADGSVQRTVEVEGVTFDSFPLIDGTQGEYEQYNLTGIGEKISNLATA